jgi:hypothetical protein
MHTIDVQQLRFIHAVQHGVLLCQHGCQPCWLLDLLLAAQHQRLSQPLYQRQRCWGQPHPFLGLRQGPGALGQDLIQITKISL